MMNNDQSHGRGGFFMRLALVILAVSWALPGAAVRPAEAASSRPGHGGPGGAYLSENQAFARAISILMGDPYGQTAAEVARIITDTALRTDGPLRACSGIAVPVWEFHVVVDTGNPDNFNNGVIDGYMAVNARDGELVCANLPLLE
ncbi:hypothetical protein ACLB6G_04575 [Zhengella sp. ZM62]|uniref:hypothetical protein n=1 Tax=Zhengella sedimenti TaxID=3390035 RepID=UPI0039766CDB